MQIVLTSCCVHEGKLEITKLNFHKLIVDCCFMVNNLHILQKYVPRLSRNLNKCWLVGVLSRGGWCQVPGEGCLGVAHICHAVLATSRHLQP